MKIPRVTKNNFWFICFFLLLGCNSRTPNISYIPPPPPDFAPVFPPNFIPKFTIKQKIQINPLPHPLSVNGEIPFAIWVDGECLELSNRQIIDLTKSLNIKYQRPKDTAEIHNGKGWLRPFRSEQLIVNE